MHMDSWKQKQAFTKLHCKWYVANMYHSNTIRMLNHAHSTENPFAGSPDGPVIMPTLYSPIAFNVHYGAIPQVYDSALVTRVGEVTSYSTINVSVEDLYLVEYTNVVYSLSGHYVANITSTVGGHPDLPFEFVIEIEGKP